MKRILLFVHELTYSGSPSSTLRLARALKELNYGVETWSYLDGPFRNEYEKYGITINIVPKEELRKRKNIIKVLKFDLLIANSILTCEAFEGISKIIPSMWYIREAENIPDFFENNYKRGIVLKEASNILAVSEYAGDYIKKYFNSNVQVLHNCVDDLYQRYVKINNIEHKIKIVMVGTIEKRKNFLLLVDSFINLSKEYRRQLEIHLVGRHLESEKSYFDSVMSKVENNDDIFFHGEIRDRDKLMSLLSEMDVVAVVSKDESCSLTALEGAMMSKPLILSENIGAKYIVDSSNGWIVKTDNIEALQMALIEVCEAKLALGDMGKISRKRYEETSTFEIYKNNVKKIIEKQRRYKGLYWISNFINRKIWFYDDTNKYYRYPEWGSEEKEKHIYSFDIFDTLITRDVATPRGIFVLMQKKLCQEPKYREIQTYIKENFVDLRMGAENFARQVYCVNGIEDKTFIQIYEALCSTGKITNEEAELLMQLEVELEIEHCIGVKENIESLRQLVLEGKKVILISDMYLPSYVIRRMLDKVDDIFKDIPIYVSAECGYMKGTTHLFKYVQAKEKVSFNNWTHVGDNINADINSPTKLGISCIRSLRAVLTKEENAIIRKNEKNIYLQQIIGINRILRVTRNEDMEDDNLQNFIISILVLYICWCGNQLEKEKKYRIYVSGKIGKIIKGLLQVYLKDFNIEIINIHEWMINHRRNWKLPIQKFADILEFDLINQKLKIKEFFEIFDISEDSLNDYIFPISDYELYQDNTEVLKVLFRNEKFLQLIDVKRKSIVDKYKKCISYAIYIGINSSEIKNITNYFNVKFKEAFLFSSINSQISYDTSINNRFYMNLTCEECKKVESILKSVSNIFTTSVFENCVFSLKYIKNKLERDIFDKESVYYLLHENLKSSKSADAERKYEVYSFGLYDTLITYDLASKDGIFLLIQKELDLVAEKYGFSKQFVEGFVNIRKNGEDQVLNKCNELRRENLSIDIIYDYIEKSYGISKDAISYLKKLELDIFYTHSVPIWENISKMRKVVDQCCKVLIIVNSIYDEKFISKILYNIDPVFEKVKVYTTASCSVFIDEPENFYKHIKEREAIQDSKWLHLGYDLKFDINRPKLVGIDTERTLLAKLLPYENAAVEELGNELSVQVKIGCARKNRVNLALNKEEIIGNCLAGPMLYSYVQWVINDAINRNFEKLLFVARDGFVLKLIADIIIRNQKLKMKTEYVYGSRRAWRMPSYSAKDNLDIFFKMAHIDQLSDMEAFSRIFRLSYQELEEFLPIQYQYSNYCLVKKDYKILRDYLESNLKFKELLEAKAKEERVKIIKYFSKKYNDKCAFVELSGTGTTQLCLAKIIKEISSGRIYTYFLNLDGMRNENYVINLNYLPNNSSQIWIIENLCRAPHGQVIGYKDNTEEVMPILSESLEKEALIKHGYRQYIQGIILFADTFSKNISLNISEMESPVLFQKYLKHIVYNPCKEVLEFIGDMPFESTGYNDKVEIFAPKLSEIQMEEIFLTRGEESIDSYYRGACFDYSIKRMTEEEKQRIEYFKKSVATREGQIARHKKRVKDKGLVYAIDFLYKRMCREVLLKIGLIKY